MRAISISYSNKDKMNETRLEIKMCFKCDCWCYIVKAIDEIEALLVVGHDKEDRRLEWGRINEIGVMVKCNPLLILYECTTK